ncbi:MAG: hypothetical protein ACRYGK_16670 [Janthinobacterium lividum]
MGAVNAAQNFGFASAKTHEGTETKLDSLSSRDLRLLAKFGSPELKEKCREILHDRLESKLQGMDDDKLEDIASNRHLPKAVREEAAHILGARMHGMSDDKLEDIANNPDMPKALRDEAQRILDARDADDNDDDDSKDMENMSSKDLNLLAKFGSPEVQAKAKDILHDRMHNSLEGASSHDLNLLAKLGSGDVKEEALEILHERDSGGDIG